jgi:hypothetical protein
MQAVMFFLAILSVILLGMASAEGSERSWGADNEKKKNHQYVKGSNNKYNNGRKYNKKPYYPPAPTPSPTPKPSMVPTLPPIQTPAPTTSGECGEDTNEGWDCGCFSNCGGGSNCNAGAMSGAGGGRFCGTGVCCCWRTTMPSDCREL